MRAACPIAHVAQTAAELPRHASRALVHYLEMAPRKYQPPQPGKAARPWPVQLSFQAVGHIDCVATDCRLDEPEPTTLHIAVNEAFEQMGRL